MSRIFHVVSLLVIGVSLLCWLPFDVGSAQPASSDRGYSVIDDYWSLDNNGGGRLLFVSGDPGKTYVDGSYGYGIGESDGAPNRANGTTAAGTYIWGDEVDRRYVRPLDGMYCVWDLDDAYEEIVVFPAIDGDWLANLYDVWGSNDFQASNQRASVWTKATLIRVYARGWSEQGEARFDPCGDDYVTVWGWPSSGVQDGGFRFVKVAPACISPASNDAEIDAVKGVLSASCGAWQTSVVEKGRAISHSSIAWGADNSTHAAYGGDQLIYAKRDPGSDTWRAEEVDSGGVGAFCSLALDFLGRPGISYYDAGAGDLKYAHQDAGGGWTTEAVDSLGDLGQYTSLAFSGGLPCISYYDATNSDLKCARWTGSAWVVQVVDSPGWVGQYTSLAVDNAGRPFISYYDATGEDLKIARWDDAVSRWEIGTVDAAGDVGQYSSIGFDSAWNPAVSYHDATEGNLKYAAWTGLGWEIGTVDSEGWAGECTSLAFDGSSHPSISYFDAESGEVRCAKWSGTRWQVSLVDSGANAVRGTALDLNGSGTAAIAFYDAADDALQVANPEAGGWQVEQVAGYPWAGRYSSLAFDASNQAAVSFYDPREGDLKYARWLDDHWEAETVDANADTGRFSSLILDGAGRPCIAYYEVSRGNLKYARWDGSAWVIEVLDQAGDVGSYASLASDNAGRPAVAYYDATSGDLKCCRRVGAAWVVDVVDSAGDVGSFASLAFDAGANPGIAYYDETQGQLNYARLSEGVWHIEVVDSGGDVGSYCSLSFDCAGNPGISYYDATSGDLKYAHWSGTEWRLETVDSAGQTGLYTSLRFDAAGNAAVSYHDATRGALRMARCDGTEWTLKTVDGCQGAGWWTSLVFDSCGSPAIAYDAAVNGDVRYASPCNPQPVQPVNLSPASEDTDIVLTATLECEVFEDPCGDAHRASQWVVTTDNCEVNCTIIYDSGVDAGHLLNIEIPAGVLQPITTYYWCVRHQDCRGVWSEYSVKTPFTTASPPERPANVAPADLAVSVGLTPTLEASGFADAQSGDTHLASEWQVTSRAGDYSAPVFQQIGQRSGLTSMAVREGALANRTVYYWRVRYQDNHGTWSDFSAETGFATNNAPEKPANELPAGGASGVGVTPTLESSAFLDVDQAESHLASQWRITGVAGDYSTPVLDTGTVTSDLTQLTVGGGSLQYDTTYYWQVRHQDSQGSWSAWSAETGFATGPRPSMPAALVLAAAAVAVVAVVAVTVPLVLPL